MIDVPAVEAHLLDVLASTGVPGVAVGIVHGAEERFLVTGITNVDHPLPVDLDTLFQIGSTTKTVTATVVLHLVEQDLLDLDEPVITFVPDLRLADPDATRHATLRHCLTHTGGWDGDYFPDFGRGDDALARTVASMASLPQVAPLGRLWSYNNAGFYLVGRAIECVTGEPFESVVRAVVLEPLGLTGSFFAEDLIARRVAAGHWVEAGRTTVATPWAMPRSLNAAGGLVLSIRDLVRYAKFHLGLLEPTRHVIDNRSRRLMQTAAAPAGTWADAVALPWLIRYAGDTAVLSHGGASNGQVTGCLLEPDAGLGLLCLTNADAGGAVPEALLAMLLDDVLGIRPPAPTYLDATVDQLRGLSGTFDCPAYVASVRVDDGGLTLRVAYKDFAMFHRPDPPEMQLSLTAPDRVIVRQGPQAGARAEFLRDDAGAVGWLRWDGRVAPRVGV